MSSSSFGSPQSWVSESGNVLPDFERWPETGFEPPADRGPRVLSLVVEGSFDSYFADRESPLLADPPEAQDAPADADEGAAPDAAADDAETSFASTIERSPSSARLIVIGSSTFASDMALELASQGMGTLYTVPVELMQNAVDWALEDAALLAIRGRAQYARTLDPAVRDERSFWEYLNYGLAAGLLAGVWLWRRWVRRRDALRYRSILAEA